MRRREMLDAARAVFAEKGYAAATVDEIAERAQFGKGTIYLYFGGGKEEILATLLDGLFREVSERVDVLIAAMRAGESTGKALLERYLAWLVGHMVENRDLFVVSARESDRTLTFEGESGSVLWDRRFGESVAQLATFFELSMDRGEVRVGDPLLLAHVCIGILRGYLMRYLTSGERPPDAQTAAQELVEMLYAGVRSTPSGA